MITEELLLQQLYDCISNTEQQIDQAHLDGLLSEDMWLQKRLFLRSVSYVAYDLDLSIEGQLEVLKEIVKTIDLIKQYA